MVCNNIFVNGKNNGCPVYIMSNTNSTYYQRDYNNYYSGGTFVAYIGSSKKSLQEVQVVDTLLDQHSVSIAPVWVDSSRTLDVRNKSSYVCLLQPGVNIDINGLQRSLRTEMGCYGKKTDSINACLTGFADMEKIVLPLHRCMSDRRHPCAGRTSAAGVRPVRGLRTLLSGLSGERHLHRAG